MSRPQWSVRLRAWRDPGAFHTEAISMKDVGILELGRWITLDIEAGYRKFLREYLNGAVADRWRLRSYASGG